MIGRPARVLITGQNLGLFRPEDFSIHFKQLGGGRSPEPVSLWDTQRMSHVSPGFLRPQFYFGASGVTAGVDFEDIMGVGSLARHDPILHVKIRSVANIEEPLIEHPVKETQLSWTSDGTASGLQPMDLVATAICKAAIEIVSLGLCTSHQKLKIEHIEGHPRALKVTNALRKLSTALGVDQEFAQLYEGLICGHYVDEAFNKILEHPLVASIALKLQEKAEEHTRTLYIELKRSDKWYNPAVLTGLYVWHHCAAVWQRFANRSAESNQKVALSYLNLRTGIEDVCGVDGRNLHVLEDHEDTYLTASLDDSHRRLLDSTFAEIVRPILQLRQACNRLVIVSLMG